MHISNTVIDRVVTEDSRLTPIPSQAVVSEKSWPDTIAKDCPLRRITIPVIEKNATEEENNTDILHSSCENSSFEEIVNAASFAG